MRAAEYASACGRGAAFVLAASRLAFCGGFDLDDPEVLAEAAAVAGLRAEETTEAARDPGRDAPALHAAASLARGGATALPVLQVGRTLLCAERGIAAAAALLDAGP
jgi:predicted DsbA family dithiol-disulfide isomerase